MFSIVAAGALLLLTIPLALLVWRQFQPIPHLQPWRASPPPVTWKRPASLGLLAFSQRESGERAAGEVATETEAQVREAQRQQQMADALLRIGSELAASSDLDIVLHKALRLVNEFVGARRGVIMLAQPDRENLIVRASLGAGEPLPEGGRPSPFARGEGLAGWIIQHQQPAVIDNLTEDVRWIRYQGGDPEHRSALGVPLTINEDTVGAMLFLSQHPAAFKADQLSVVSAAATQVAAAIYNAELFRLIRDQATQHGGMIRERRIEASKSQAILESIAEGVLVTDADNRVSLFNAAAERILGLGRQQVLGQPASDFIGIYGEAGERWMRAVRRWAEEGSVEVEASGPIDARLTLDDGRFVALTIAPVQLDGDFLGTVTTLRDITKEVEVDRLKSEFVATVSHELRTPMTSVKGYVEMLLMEAAGGINENQRRFLQVIKTNIDRLGSLVNDLLDISRIEAGRVQLEIEPVDLGGLLGEIREAFMRRGRLESRPIAIDLSLPEELPPVAADRERLRQIVGNLVENSFNYTPADGHIRLEVHALADNITLEVTDNGIGIDPTEQDRVFERFYRGEQALEMAVGGSGLGLSIVRQLVEMHDGGLEVSSTGIPGEGTTFTLSLPAASSSDHGMDK